MIEKAASEAGWGRQMPKGSGLGISAHRSFVSYSAVVTEVAVGDKGEITIPRVDIAFDCGAVVNPDRVRSQLEGACVQGISLAMLGEISFKNGRPQQTNFDGYELTRMDGAPTEIRAHLVNSAAYDKPLGGVGEPGVPPVAPALPTRSSPPPASASAACRSATSSRARCSQCRRPDRSRAQRGAAEGPSLHDKQPVAERGSSTPRFGASGRDDGTSSLPGSTTLY